ncbi:uncharacterized protein LOC134233256 [Saccostrea cucullata]|uniref:uncharacterized protein LOC134233256 n=1 Tax=Saccostrea cuccullata TaxID=36930 RepID=UPI002ED321F3
MISDESKKHDIVRFNLKKSTPIYPGCPSHVKERCEMYCDECDFPVCTTCLASDHHLGHKLLKVLQVLEDNKAKIIKEHNELKETIYPTFQDIACDLQTLQKHLDDIKKTMSDIKDEIDTIESDMDTNDLSKLFSFSSNMKRFRNIPEKIETTSPIFTPGRIHAKLEKNFGALSSSSLTAEKHGYNMKTTQKSPEAKFSLPVRQLLDTPQSITTIDTGYENLVNVACLSDEEIWTSGLNSTMELYNMNQGSLLKSIKSNSGNIPSDITVTKSGDLVYTDYIDRTLNIVKNEKIDEVVRLKNWIPIRVCSTSSDDLLVILVSVDFKPTKVVCYSGSRKKQTIQVDDQGKPLYSSGSYYRNITENRNLDICVSDEGVEAVVVVNQARILRFRYTGNTPAQKNQSFCPRGITTNSQSHILIADYNNDCVHIIDQDGQFLRYINFELSEPLGLYKHGYSMKTTQKSPEAGSSPQVKQLLDEPETVTSIVKKSPEAGSSPPVKQLLDEPKTVIIINTGYRDLFNVACLSDEEIWTSGGDSTMKLFSINQRSLLKSITTKSGNTPFDIAVTKSGDLLYTDHRDRTVNIVKNEKIEEVIRLQNWRPRGVCSTSSGDLLVIMSSDDYKQAKVVRYSGSRKKQTIQVDDQGKPLYSSGTYYRFIIENRNLDICVSDCGGIAVVVVNQAGKLRFRYTGQTPAPKNKTFKPRGITTDSQSHILTADYNNDCVHIIDQDGQFLRYIECGLSYPWGLCIDTNDNLFVGQWLNRKVKKIKYLS